MDDRDLIHYMANVNKELCEALRATHDHLLMNNQTHTRTYKMVKNALDKHDHITQVQNKID